MSPVGVEKGGVNKEKHSEKNPMAWDADNQHTAQERRVGPVDCNHCISLGDGYRISSADNHGARPTDAGGPAIAPLSVEDATLESTTDGTVCIPCPHLP